MYKSEEYSPKEIIIETYWKHGKVSTLREGLPHDHEENLWNWFRREYPELNPLFYGVEMPQKRIKTIKFKT